MVPKNLVQVSNLQHQAVFNEIRSPALRPPNRHLQQHQRQPGGDRRERRRRLRAAEGAAYVALHHGPLGQIVRTAQIPRNRRHETIRDERQMKALLPPDSNPGTYFMSAFLLRLPADVIDHIISQDFKDCTKMAEYANKLYARRRGNAVAAVTDSPVHAVSGGGRRESSPHDRRRRSPSRSAAGRPPGRTRMTATSVTITPPTANRLLSANLAASGSRETDQPPGTERSRRRHDFFTG